MNIPAGLVSYYAECAQQGIRDSKAQAVRRDKAEENAELGVELRVMTIAESLRAEQISIIVDAADTAAKGLGTIGQDGEQPRAEGTKEEQDEALANKVHESVSSAAKGLASALKETASKLDETQRSVTSALSGNVATIAASSGRSAEAIAAIAQAVA